MTPWTAEETRFLLDNHPELSFSKIGLSLGRSRKSVSRKMDRIRKPEPSRRPPGGKPGAKPGEAHHKAKLTEDMVRDMRRKYAEGGYTHFSLWQEYYEIAGIESTATISAILTRKNWKHVA